MVWKKMLKQRTCPLCENISAWELPVPGQDKYEIKCGTCIAYYLTDGPDKGFINLPKEDRMLLSAYVREQYEKNKMPVHLDQIENFRDILDDRKG
jgi:hypothetical protein